MKVTGFQMQQGHLLAWVDIGPSTAVWAFHPEQVPALGSACDVLCAAVLDAVTLQMIEALPAAPDNIGEVAPRPCRICDQVTPSNVTDERGLTFCQNHLPRRAP